MTDDFLQYFKSNYTIRPDETVRSNTGRVKTSKQIFEEYAKVRISAGQMPTVNLQDVEAFLTEELDKVASANKQDEFPLTAHDYVQKFLHDHINKDWRIDSSFRMIERLNGGIPINSDINDLANAIFVQAIKECCQKKYKQGEIKASLIDIATVFGTNAVAKIAAKIEYDATCLDKASTFFHTLHDEWKIKQSFEVFEGVMRHFLWQCKRKLLGRNVTWDLLVNIYGGSGIGKTTMVQDIGKVFQDFSIVSTLSEVLDTERQVKKLAECYYVNLDELATGNASEFRYGGSDSGSLDKAQKTAFKKLMTQRKARTRNMGGQSQSTQRYTFSFIASSNTHLADVIYDETTMRRYVEIECENKDIQDYSKLEEAKKLILDVWKSVDENDDRGYWYPGCKIWAEVKKMQDTYYPSNTTTASWIKEFSVVPCNSNAKEKLGELYESYKAFCNKHENRPKCYDNWIKDLHHLIEGGMAPDGNISIRRTCQEPKNDLPTASRYDLF